MGRFLVLGKEERQKYLFEMLCKKGQTVTFCDFWHDGWYHAIMLPVAKSAEYLERIEAELQAGEYVFGCNFPQEIVERKRGQGIFFIDYMKEEGTAHMNAALTAEGTVAEALMAGKERLFGKEMLVMGYGRCGQALARRLLALGGKVAIYEKDKERLAMARADGLAAIDSRKLCALAGKEGQDAEAAFWKRFLYIFNTVPALVLDAGRLAHVRQEAVLIDIASAPGGIDFDYCMQNNLNARICGGLPAKYAPKSAAELLLRVIESHLKEVMYDEGE